MARDRVGKCPVCGRRVHIYSARYVRPGPESDAVVRVTEPRIIIASHSPGADGLVFGGGQCRGTSMEPAPDPKLDRERQKRELKRQAKLRELLAPFHGHAMVAMDALLEGKGWRRDELLILARVATYYYRLHYPDRPLWSVLRYAPRFDRRARPTGRGDAYCGFCGILWRTDIAGASYTLSGWVQDTAYLDSLARAGDMHPIVCALQHFVHELVPADPSVRRLPPEYAQDEQEEPAA
jgi:hypothetical protein